MLTTTTTYGFAKIAKIGIWKNLRYEREDMNELQIDIAEQGKITTNLNDLKEELQKLADRYAGAVVSEDTVSLAKKDVAELRKIRTDIEDRRKEIKKKWNEPYTAFEEEVKSALAIIDKPIDEINKQVKAFELADKEAKKEKVKEIYKSYTPADIEPYMPFETVFDEKWLNKSTKENEIISDLSAKITQIKIDIDAIKALGSEIEDKCLEAYKTGGMALAIQRNTDYLNAKAQAEVRAREEAERKVREEQERKAREEQEKAEKEQTLFVDDIPIPKDLPFPTEEPFKIEVEPVEEDLPFPLPTFRFEITGRANIDKVKQFLEFSKISYTEI